MTDNPSTHDCEELECGMVNPITPECEGYDRSSFLRVPRGVEVEPREYVKKPVVIKAMQFTGSNAQKHAVYQWVEENTLGSHNYMDWLEDPTLPVPESGVSIDPDTGDFMIATLEGWMRTRDGWFVIQGIKGEFYSCDPVVFWGSYTEKSKSVS